MRGWDYRLIYCHPQQRVFLRSWSAEQQRWITQTQPWLQTKVLTDTPGVVIQLPAGSLLDPDQFCWRALTSYIDQIYNPTPPGDIIPDSARDFWLTQYQMTKTITNSTRTTTP